MQLAYYNGKKGLPHTQIPTGIRKPHTAIPVRFFGGAKPRANGLAGFQEDIVAFGQSTTGQTLGVLADLSMFILLGYTLWVTFPLVKKLRRKL